VSEREIRVLRLSEIMQAAERFAPLPDEGTPGWGPWRLDPDALVLICLDEHGYWQYELDLEALHGASRMLDMIAQVAMKTWATHEIIGGLVQALDDVFELQANVVHRTDELTPAVVARLVGSHTYRPEVCIRAEDVS
jgi:hypothetical protein